MKIRALLFVQILVVGLNAQVLQPDISTLVGMRDGKEIATDVYLPGEGSYPVILIQTPYNKNLYRLGGLPLKIRQNIELSAYAVVIADWRCFYGSTQACVVQPDRGKDGYDLIDWISKQAWCNGMVGTWGPSALGKIQYQTAREKHPAHRCAVPLVAGPQVSYQEYYPGGCLRTEYLEQLDALGYNLSGAVLANPTYNLSWQILETQNQYYSQIQIPMLLIGGWYDHNTDLQIEDFQKLRSGSALSVRNSHRLLMGPWVHGGFRGTGPGSSSAGELNYPLAQGWADSLALAFFDFHLRGIENHWEDSPPVHYYRMGLEKWESSDQYPPEAIQEVPFYLQNTGRLSKELSISSSRTYTYNPSDPSPTVGGATLRNDLLQGPYDQTPQVESRQDILTYTSDSLQEVVSLNGKSRAIIWISSDRMDTDLCLRLTDVYPDGRSMLLAEGVRRLRFRNSYNQPELMVPGQAVEVEVNMPALSHSFLPGHRIRLNVSSSNYPRFDANLNNGGTMYVAGDTLIAVQTVYHGTEMPSRLLLQVDHPMVNSTEMLNTSPVFRIFPNPSQGKCTLKSENKGVLRLFSFNGQMLETIALTGEWQEWEPSLVPGVYLLVVTDENGTKHYQKFIRI